MVVTDCSDLLVIDREAKSLVTSSEGAAQAWVLGVKLEQSGDGRLEHGGSICRYQGRRVHREKYALYNRVVREYGSLRGDERGPCAAVSVSMQPPITRSWRTLVKHGTSDHWNFGVRTRAKDLTR
jgi:hypothetical protein